MAWKSPEDAMPWVGMYIALASMICTLAMAADVVRSFWQWKLWFPNKFFTLNASTITIMAIALKLPVDLTTKMSETEDRATKVTGIYFLITMLANFLPSLGLMDDRELLMNIVALGILVVTILVNISIQIYTQVLTPSPFEVITFIFLFPFLWPFSVALTVSASRKRLEQRYKESQRLVSNHQKKMFSSKELRSCVKKYWMMTETRNPQFVIACSPVSSAFGVICLFLAFVSIVFLGVYINDPEVTSSEYKKSTKITFIIQSIGIIVGSIAPVFRCVTSIGHYTLSKEWSKNQLNIFRVEKHWIQTLQHWKRSHVQSHIPGRHCKIVFHNVKKTFLNICLGFHIAVLIVCKTISLVPKIFLLILSYCWYFLKSISKRFKNVAKVSSSHRSSEIEEYTRYVVQIEEDAKLSNRILRNTLRSVSKLLDESEKKEPHNLLMFLEKSRGFNGVVEFDNDKVQHSYPQEIHNCWSLVVVTLTTIAIALPNIANNHFKGLLSSIREGLEIVRHVEECLNTDDEIVMARKSARHVWTEVEIYHSWLEIDLQKMARKGKTSKDILAWLGDEAKETMEEFKSNKNPSTDRSSYKFILANSMYRISQTILLHHDEEENTMNDEKLLEWISTIIADILFACFTNLPRVIKMKCHHHTIEKRGDSIRSAAELLGKSKKILKNLKTRQFPNIDQDSMAYIDKWRVQIMSQMRSVGTRPGDGPIPNHASSSANILTGSSSFNELLIVNVM